MTPGRVHEKKSARNKLFLSVLAAASIPLITTLFAADTAKLPAPASRAIDFNNDVQPIFQRCAVCHGEQQQMSGFRLDRRDEALRGGYSGTVIIPGKSAESRLIHLVAGLEEKVVMPPAGERLSANEIGILRAWIDQGAEWPAEAATPTATKPPEAATKTSSASKHWAFQPIARPSVPTVKNASWARNPIDAFVLARLEREAVKPAAEAGKETLLRRVYLDLIGLPPSPAEVAAFVSDPSPQAYERVVDRLMESEHYGERRAIQWLDLARYADSDGYEKDQIRPHAWRYRHWVVNALNRDMPFDEFTLEQIAGDLLPNATVEQEVATGLHRNTLTNREGGVKLEQFRFEETVDRANTVGTVWLGLTVGCAQCHDHKYDPITQKDYYQFYAFFNNIEEAHIDAPLPGEVGPYLRTHAEYAAKRRKLLDEYCVNREFMDPWEEKLIYAADHPGELTDWDVHYDTLEKMTDGGHKIVRTPPNQRTEREQRMLIDFLLQWYNQVASKERVEELKFKDLQEKLAELDKTYPHLSQARVVFEKNDPRETYLHVRGAWDRQGIPVNSDTPAVLPAMRAMGNPTRADLARWLVSRDNPLTARVTVNRLWLQYFGRGIVSTSDNFGTQGARPSHPELLDWLASEFMEHGWSQKHINKLIVMSATYRQSSEERPDVKERDPDNNLLARQTRLRLPAELVRDSALQASGLLYPKVGGPSVQPPLPEGVQMLFFADGAFTPQDGRAQGIDLYRRGLYIHLQRTVLYPFLTNFDRPDGTVTVCQRERSNTPLQALNLLNDPVFFEAAQALAARVLQETPSDKFADRLGHAFQLCVARDPTDFEQERLLKYYVGQKQLLDEDAIAKLLPVSLEGVDRKENATWVGLSRILLNMDEFVTRE